MKEIIAYWTDYMNAYRLYTPEAPQNTIAYEDAECIEERCKEEGYDKIIYEKRKEE